MNLTLHIALSHLNGRKRQTIVSLVGIMLGVAFFVAVTSLMRGSDQDFIRRMIETWPHITIRDEFRNPTIQPVQEVFKDAAIEIRGLKPKEEYRGVAKYREIVDYVRSLDGVKIGQIMTGPSIVNYRGMDYSLTINGIRPEELEEVTTLKEYMVEGSIDNLRIDTDGIIVGKTFVDSAGLKMGDRIVITPSSSMPRIMKIVGIFETGSGRSDRSTAYINLKKAQNLFDRPNRINSIILRMSDPYSAINLAAEIEEIFRYRSESWQEVSADIMNTMAIRNGVMYAVVSAILIVASIGIYNVIYTVVMEKTRDIAILKSMGFLPSDISNIFILQGLMLGVVGSLMGCALGRGLLSILGTFRLRLPGSSKLQPFPLDYSIDQYLLAAGVATLAAFVAALIPSNKAGDLPPVDILRGAS